ncbi:hypothetical protein Ssi03_55800 [Sphaerisporangium siamense]|nr:hypothetical protein Ssi03_55800 [Sphaerisporangium siamense]
MPTLTTTAVSAHRLIVTAVGDHTEWNSPSAPLRSRPGTPPARPPSTLVSCSVAVTPHMVGRAYGALSVRTG